jgi:cell division protein FtsL
MLLTWAMALLIVASAVFANIWMVNSTMRLMVVSQQLEQSIKQVRADGHQLESQYSGLTNPQRIQRLAEELGMVPDSSPEFLRLGDTTTDVDDSLSLPESPKSGISPDPENPGRRLADIQ